jgi:AmmeMemoRadiSam system protein B
MYELVAGIRQPAVAGTFYPADPEDLYSEVVGYLRMADDRQIVPKALIVPHAGYPYSGPVAASAYKLVAAMTDRINRVVLIGPSHHLHFYGLAASGSEAFATPLGSVPVDQTAVKAAVRLPQVHLLDEAHVLEHSLEVQLPFLQVVLREFSLVPLAVGQADAAEVAEVMERLWGGHETLIVVSSDLSHYQPYRRAQSIDRETADLIERCQWERLTAARACGYGAVCGLLEAARRKRLTVKQLDLRNSGDTAGPKDQVVGYGSFAVIES